MFIRNWHISWLTILNLSKKTYVPELSNKRMAKPDSQQSL